MTIDVKPSEESPNLELIATKKLAAMAALLTTLFLIAIELISQDMPNHSKLSTPQTLKCGTETISLPTDEDRYLQRLMQLQAILGLFTQGGWSPGASIIFDPEGSALTGIGFYSDKVPQAALVFPKQIIHTSSPTDLAEIAEKTVTSHTAARQILAGFT